MPFFSSALILLDRVTVSFSGTPAVPLAVVVPATVVDGRHLCLIFTWPFVHFFGFFALAATAEVLAIDAVGTVTTIVPVPPWTGTNVIVTVPFEFETTLWIV